MTRLKSGVCLLLISQIEFQQTPKARPYSNGHVGARPYSISRYR